jgi:hypothetical protein
MRRRPTPWSARPSSSSPRPRSSAAPKGAQFLSLSGAPLARVDRGQPVRPLQRILDLAGRVVEPVYGFRRCSSSRPSSSPATKPLVPGVRRPGRAAVHRHRDRPRYLPRLSPAQLGRLGLTLIVHSRLPRDHGRIGAQAMNDPCSRQSPPPPRLAFTETNLQPIVISRLAEHAPCLPRNDRASAIVARGGATVLSRRPVTCESS